MSDYDDTITGSNKNDIVTSSGLWVWSSKLNAYVLVSSVGTDQADGNLNDAVFGGNGNDYLFGGKGSDHLEGQNGSDTIWGDRIATLGSGGAITSTTDYTGADAGADVLIGGNGEDELHGGDGADTLWGGGDGDESTNTTENGKDTLFGDAGDDVLHGGNGKDWLDGGADGDWLFGENGEDRLEGGTGRDTLIGGRGADELIGGADDDHFLYLAADHSPAGGGFDCIVDFSPGVNYSSGDKIDLTPLGGPGSDLIWHGAWGGTTAYAMGVWYVDVTGGAMLYADVHGDAIADLQIFIKNMGDVQHSDILGLVNGAAVALDDDNSLDAVIEDTDPSASGNVLSNDSDPDGDTLVVTTTGSFGGIYGSLTLAADGSYTYTLDNSLVQWLADGEVVTDDFLYTASDGALGNSATLTITIEGVNDDPVAQDVAGAASEDGAPVVASYDADDIDSDDDPTTLLYAVTSAPSEGSALDNGDGTFTFDPGADFQDLALGEIRDVSFDYSATDSHGASDTGTVTVTVTGVNDDPVAQDVLAAASEDGAPVVASYDADDVDSDDDPTTLVYAVTSFPSEGSALDNGDGTFTFDPGADFQDLALGEIRDVSFDYSASDSHGASDTGTVTVTVTGVNDDPVAQDVAASASEDGAGVVGSYDADDVDSDDDPTTLLYAVTSAPAEGSAYDNGDGTFTFDPGADFQDLAEGEIRDVSFDYSATDSHGASDSASITVTVTGVNDDPVADDQAFSVNENSANGTAVGTVVATDLDNGAVLGYAITGGNTSGAFSINALTGAILVANSAALDFETTPTFNLTVEVTDEHGATDSATVTINLEDVAENVNPTAVNDVWILSQNTAVTLPSIAVLANDSDPTGDSLAISSVTGATLNADGSISLSVGTANGSFTYTITDGHGGTATATVNYTVVNANPGFDLSTFTYNASYLDAAGGNDSLTGGTGFDALLGGTGSDNLIGGSNNDILRGGTGNDTMDGGLGIDLLDFSDATSAINLTVFNQGTDAGGFFAVSVDALGSDSYRNMEGVIGSANNDTINGSSLGDWLDGNAGNDSIFGGSGSDTIIGGVRADVLRGGVSVAVPDDLTSDTFLYRNQNEGGDTINGFNTGTPASTGDVLDFRQIFDLNPSATVLFENSGGNTAVKLDLDGNLGTLGDQFTMATLTGVNPLTAAADLADNILM